MTKSTLAGLRTIQLAIQATGVDKTWIPLSGPPSGAPSGPHNCFGQKRNNNRLKLYTVRVLHTTASFAL